MRPFKGIFYNDISEFESDHLSQAVVSYQLTFELLQKLGIRARGRGNEGSPMQAWDQGHRSSASARSPASVIRMRVTYIERPPAKQVRVLSVKNRWTPNISQ